MQQLSTAGSELAYGAMVSALPSPLPTLLPPLHTLAQYRAKHSTLRYGGTRAKDSSIVVSHTHSTRSTGSMIRSQYRPRHTLAQYRTPPSTIRYHSTALRLAQYASSVPHIAAHACVREIKGIHAQARYKLYGRPGEMY
eukprot:3941166-Rhodomonas_salina.2